MFVCVLSPNQIHFVKDNNHKIIKTVCGKILNFKNDNLKLFSSDNTIKSMCKDCYYREERKYKFFLENSKVSLRNVTFSKRFYFLKLIAKGKLTVENKYMNYYIRYSNYKNNRSFLKY